MSRASDNSTSLRQEYAGLCLANEGTENMKTNYRDYRDYVRFKGLGFLEGMEKKVETVIIGL